MSQFPAQRFPNYRFAPKVRDLDLTADRLTSPNSGLLAAHQQHRWAVEAGECFRRDHAFTIPEHVENPRGRITLARKIPNIEELDDGQVLRTPGPLHGFL